MNGKRLDMPQVIIYYANSKVLNLYVGLHNNIEVLPNGDFMEE